MENKSEHEQGFADNEGELTEERQSIEIGNHEDGGRFHYVIQMHFE